VLPNVAEFAASFFGSRSSRAPRNRSLEDPNVSLNDPEFWEALGHVRSDSGIEVGPEEALRFGPVYQCIEIKSADVGCATFHVHKNDAEPGEDDIDRNQPAERVCSSEWNDITPASQGWQNLVFHYSLRGNGYAYISRQGGSQNGRIQWMANLAPDRVTPMTDPDSGALLYKLEISGEQPQFLNSWEVFHLKGLSLNGQQAIDMLKLSRNEIGLALASKLFLAKFFERGGHHGGILSVPPAMKAQARENLEKGVAERSSPANWFKTLVLRDGAQWHSSTVDPRTAQMSELTEDEARAVCHFFNMPPWKIGLKDSQSYNSGEMANLAYITGTLQHVCMRIQGEANIKLLSQRTRRSGTHRFEHNFTKLLEADVTTLNRVLAIQRSQGIINANDWRKKINLPLRSDAEASLYFNPNTTRTGSPANADPASATAGTSGSQSDSGSAAVGNSKLAELRASFMGYVAQKAAARLAAVCKNKARKPADMLAWCDAGGVSHRSILTEELTAAVNGGFPENQRIAVLSACESWMLREVTAGISVFLDAPHKESELEANVGRFLEQFQSEVSSRLQKEIINAFG
jgi:HK97 family phage portal protein